MVREGVVLVDPPERRSVREPADQPVPRLEVERELAEELVALRRLAMVDAIPALPAYAARQGQRLPELPPRVQIEVVPRIAEAWRGPELLRERPIVDHVGGEDRFVAHVVEVEHPVLEGEGQRVDRPADRVEVD